MVKEKTRFRYEKRTKDDVKKRANQSGGLFDSTVKSDYQVFSPKEGDYRLRFLPPTWEQPEHFGLDIYVHYGVGSDNQSYLCLAKMRDEACPICEERKRAEKSGDADYARNLAATKRVLVWLVDRDKEEDGPQLWSMPWTFDRDVAALSIDKKSGEYLALDDPEEGYDVEFTRKGLQLKTKYIGVSVARKPSPLSYDPEQVDVWLKYVEDNPLPDVLQYYDVEHIAAIAQGKPRDDDDDDEEEERPAKKAKPGRARLADDDEDEDDEDERPVKKAKAKKPMVDEDDEEEEEEDERPSRKRRPAVDDDEDDEDEEVPPRKGKSKLVEDEDDEDDLPPRRKAVKAKAQADDDDDDDDEDEKPVRRRR